MYRELKAAFGGETTIPVEAVHASRDNIATTYGTFENSGPLSQEEEISPAPALQEVPSPKEGPKEPMLKADEISTPDNKRSPITREELVIELKASGKLAWKVVSGPQEGYRVTIENQEVEQRFLTSFGQIVGLDMDAWLEDHPQKTTEGGGNWRIALSRL
jgi:hypothetical protein